MNPESKDHGDCGDGEPAVDELYACGGVYECNPARIVLIYFARQECVSHEGEGVVVDEAAVEACCEGAPNNGYADAGDGDP